MSSAAEPSQSNWLQWDREACVWRPSPGPAPFLISDGGLLERIRSIPWQVSNELIERGTSAAEQRDQLVLRKRPVARDAGLKFVQVVIGNLKKLMRAPASVQQQQHHDFEKQQPSRNLHVQLVKRTFLHRFLPFLRKQS